ncbi:MAG: hypothetical protein IPF64_14445 [Flavobacteriales bacterium]|nr:hypothetical protein [Flavobacteriales bacterium]
MKSTFLKLAMSVIIGSWTVPMYGQSFPSGFSQSTVAGGTFSNPVGVTWDANGRQYVWEKGGRCGSSATEFDCLIH